MDHASATPIVIPLHHGGGKFRNDSELRYALRSIARHFKGSHRIIIVGKKLPAWIQGVEHVYGEGLKSSLIAAANCFPDGFLWWYDDCCLLRDSTVEELKVTPACKGWGKPKTAWSRKLEKIRQRLVKEGYPARDYSRPHGPYWFDKGMVDEGFSDWPGMKAKFPWESWILSKRDWPRCHGTVQQYYGPFRSPPGGNRRYVNWSDRGFTSGLRSYLDARFPETSCYETSVPERGPVASSSPRVTVVVAMKGRTEAWVRHARSWLNHPMVAECVVVDWSDENPVASHPGVMEIMEEYPFVKIVRVENEAAFHIGKAFNVGFSRASMDLIAKTDADVELVNPLWFMLAAKDVASGSGVFYKGKGKGLPGTFLATREMVQKVGGFREDFVGYGWDDTDLYKRMSSAGGVLKMYGKGVLYHEPHSDAKRTEYYQNKRRKTTMRRNRTIALDGSKPPPPSVYQVISSSGRLEVLEKATQRLCGPLLPLDTWAEAFEPYRGMKVNPPELARGNAGDRMIWQAVRALYSHYGLTVVSKDWDVFMWPGGGNMGRKYAGNRAIRRRHFQNAVKRGTPIVILPQSWTGDDPDVPASAVVFARERATMPPGSSLLPDLALAWSGMVTCPPAVDDRPDEEWFMRRDKEKTGDTRGIDPAIGCKSVTAYLELAAGRKHVHTNRLHFAIACLIVNTPVTLRPGSYGKNRGVWEYSLADLGCKWGGEA